MVVVLLISNIVTMSCAMAYALCDDCPDHEPVLCVDSCGTAAAAISVETPDSNANTFRPIAITNHAVPGDSTEFLNPLSVVDAPSPDPHTSPPLYLQLCVFLK